MTQYVQYLQSIGALNTWPNVTNPTLLEQHTNQIVGEAHVAGVAPGGAPGGAPGVPAQPPVFDHVHAAAAVAGAANLANNLQQPPAVQPVQPAAQPQHNVVQNPNEVINQAVPVENQNMAGPGPDGLVMNAGTFSLIFLNASSLAKVWP